MTRRGNYGQATQCRHRTCSEGYRRVTRAGVICGWAKRATYLALAVDCIPSTLTLGRFIGLRNSPP
jgi:hypothetical protein